MSSPSVKHLRGAAGPLVTFDDSVTWCPDDVEDSRCPVACAGHVSLGNVAEESLTEVHRSCRVNQVSIFSSVGH